MCIHGEAKGRLWMPPHSVGSLTQGAQNLHKHSEAHTPRRPASYGKCDMEGCLPPRTSLESRLVSLSLHARIRGLSVALSHAVDEPVPGFFPSSAMSKAAASQLVGEVCHPGVWLPSLVLGVIRMSSALRPQGASSRVSGTGS